MNQRILSLVSLYVLVIMIFALLRPDEIDWTPTFEVERDAPFASQILYQELPTIRPERLETTNRPVYNTIIDQANDSLQIYFLLNAQFEPQQLDVNKLLEFVAAGNTVFISSGRIGPQMLDTLGVRVRSEYTGTFKLNEWFYEDNLALSLKALPDETWLAATLSDFMRFEIIDTSIVFDTLGFVNETYPNFITRGFGQGRIYLHAYPYIFTNYHMLYRDNHAYISAAIGAVPTGRIWLWDQFYNVAHQRQASSPLAVFNRHLSFRWAYWISVIGIGIFIIFTAKRRQRVIPVLKPKRNMTLDFVHTIGDLYFQRADHADLIEKKIQLLKGHISKHYRMDVVDFSQDEAARLAVRSGKSVDDIEQCFAYIRNLTPAVAQRSTTVWEFQRALNKFSAGRSRAVEDN